MKAKLLLISVLVSFSVIAMEDPAAKQRTTIAHKLLCCFPRLREKEMQELTKYIEEQDQDRWHIIHTLVRWPEGFKMYLETRECCRGKESLCHLFEQLSAIPTKKLAYVTKHLRLHDGFWGQQTYLYDKEIREAIKKTN